MAGPVIAVVDPLDARIAVFRQVRERDVAGRLGLFIAEGDVVLRVLARSPLYRTQALLIAEKRIEALAPLIARFDDSVAVYSAPQSVMDFVVGFPIHRGILAAGIRGRARAPAALLANLSGPSLVLGLFGVSNHDNMGGIFRNAAAFGAKAVILDAACCDPLYRKAIRVSVGASLMVPFARLATGDDPVELFAGGGFETLALTPSGAAALSATVRPSRAAVLLGAEGAGLPAGILARSRTVGIPMRGGFDSLNVATASGIVLHYLSQ
ncbi:MAG TPA: RNA methyltransferase [Caulobacteraceae bacterium]